MAADDPETGERNMFLDKAIPFSASISCSHYQRFSNSLKHMVEYKSGSNLKIVNYLDDFLFIGEDENECNELVRKFLNLCKWLGVPVAEEKTVWGTSRITFLGIVLDGKSRTLDIPEDKRLRAVNMLEWVTNSRKNEGERSRKIGRILKLHQQGGIHR